MTNLHTAPICSSFSYPGINPFMVYRGETETRVSLAMAIICRFLPTREAQMKIIINSETSNGNYI